ncbi:hypothetical protein M3Y99_01460600 [Aphelenchoides fujianensis]|nr:hypothetical protein M3Y99_01460600 [Aphelenchoides fujianensis]
MASWKKVLINGGVSLHEIFDFTIVVLLAYLFAYYHIQQVDGAIFDVFQFNVVFYLSLIAAVLSLLLLGLLVVGNKDPWLVLGYLVLQILLRVVTFLTGLGMIAIYQTTDFNNNAPSVILAAAVVSIVSSVFFPLFYPLVFERFLYLRRTPKCQREHDDWRTKHLVIAYLTVVLLAAGVAIISCIAVLGAGGGGGCGGGCGGGSGNCSGCGRCCKDEGEENA